MVFLQGSNFTTETFFVKAPDGRKVKIRHDSGILNRIDRVTAANYEAPINQIYCRNKFIGCGGLSQMLQMPSLFFQCAPFAFWKSDEMYRIMLEIVMLSIDVLNERNQLK